MSKRAVQIVLNRPEISRQLLKGAGTKALLREIGNRVADQSGLACEVTDYDGENRSNVSVGVVAGTDDYYRNLHTNALAAALY